MTVMKLRLATMLGCSVQHHASGGGKEAEGTWGV